RWKAGLAGRVTERPLDVATPSVITSPVIVFHPNGGTFVMAGQIFKTFTRFMAAAALLLGAQLASADVTGKWAFSVDIMGQTGVAQVTLQQDDAKLSGHYSGQLGETDFDGSANGNDIEFVLVGG